MNRLKDRMYFKEYPPSRALAPYIRAYFHIRANSGECHFPADSCPGLIFNIGNPFLLGFEDHLDILTGCRLFGSFTRHLLTKHTLGETNLLAVKFHPGQLPRFFNVRASELTDTSTSIQTLWGRFGKEIEQRCYDSPNILDTITLLEQALLKRLSGNTGYDDRISFALNTIWGLRGQLRIDRLARGVNLSRRHFERRFADIVGLTPKRMCRIARFFSTFAAADVAANLDWSDLAFENGYSDQAHFIRECKFFTGQSPLSYLNSRSSLENAIMGTFDTMSHFFNTNDITPATVTPSDSKRYNFNQGGYK